MNHFYVYVHVRKDTDKVFYVGKGKGRRAYSRKSRSDFWCNVVAKAGEPEVKFLATDLNEELALLAEVEAIDCLRRRGVKLVNLTNGGDGVSGYVPLKPPHNKGKPCPEEMRARISATNKRNGVLPPIGWNAGLKTPPEVIEKRRPALVASWERARLDGSRATTEETRAKQRAAKLGRKLSEETRRRMSEGQKANPYKRVLASFKGRSHSPEARAKISAALKGRPPPNKGKPMHPASAAALAAAQARRTNFAHSEETKQKISAAQKGKKRWDEMARSEMSRTRRVAVVCVETGQVFDCALTAALHIGLTSKTLVNACCTGRIANVRGFTFRHAEPRHG